MKVRYHQYLDLFIVAMIAIACLQSVVFGNRVLDRLSMISMWVVLGSITLGVAVVMYIHIKKSQIFDPLSSELDEDPDDIEHRHLERAAPARTFFMVSKVVKSGGLTSAYTEVRPS